MNFISKVIELFTTARYMESVWRGLETTLLISVMAAILGLVLGTLVAFVTIAKPSRWMALPKALCKLYITVIRGTPMALQLCIMFYVIVTFRGVPEIVTGHGSVIAAKRLGMAQVPCTLLDGLTDEERRIYCHAHNQGAYVAENIRAGILSVDIGQTEAGRALGLSSRVTMLKIVIPQAIKNVIPAIGNELIALIKETSIVSMIGMYDLTMAAKIIGSGNNMASYIVPMSVVALFYLVIVYLLTFAIKLIERRLRAGDKR